MSETTPAVSSLRSATLVAMSGMAERDLPQGQDDKRAERGDRRGGQEDGAQRVGDGVGARGRRAVEPAREDRAEQRDTHRPAERAEQVRRRGDDAELAALDVV